MTSDIRLAFAHPSERADSLSDGRPLDRIMLRDHIREVDIGAFQLERGVLQRLRFNVVVEVSPQAKPLKDDVDRILSYDRVTDAIDAELAAERINLLETLAESVADRILAEPRAQKVYVRIEKLDRGPGALGVEIMRSERDAAPIAQPATQLHAPLIVYLSNEAIVSPNLPGWLDQLQSMQRSSILVVGLPDMSVPQLDNSAVQRRLDLLAIEQNAWMMAARDPRAVVVGSRTELDWGLHHGQLSLWAPSKLVLDALSPPEDVTDGAALAVWFAAHMEASAMLAIGMDIQTDLPSRSVDINQTLLPLAAI